MLDQQNLGSLVSPGTKVEEKRENLSPRKLRKPGEREREKYFAPFFEISHTKREKTFSEKTEKTWRKRKRKGSATFLLHLAWYHLENCDAGFRI
jgi:hypothetical protein